MNEIQAILDAIDATDDPLYLATVVDVVGSSYRRPAARMLILPEGNRIGTISGGCLERDVCRAAPELTKLGPRLISFDTRQDSTNFNPRYNMGCTGIIYILVERLTRGAHCVSHVLRDVVESNRSHVCATIYQSEGFDVPLGWRCRSVEEFVASLRPAAANSRLDELWNEVETTSRPVCCELATTEGSCRALIEKIAPAKSLWIFGAGDNAQPLSVMATQLGWQVTVIDHRASLLTAERFPGTSRVCQPWDKVTDTLAVPEDTAAVLVTHDFAADKVVIPWLLQSSTSYVGVLGPKSRTARVMKELHAENHLPSLESLDRFHTPVGLDLGASTPAEIAIAVLGEIIADANDREGGRLMAREAPIHDPVRHELIELALPRMKGNRESKTNASVTS